MTNAYLRSLAPFIFLRLIINKSHFWKFISQERYKRFWSEASIGSIYRFPSYATKILLMKNFPKSTKFLISEDASFTLKFQISKVWHLGSNIKWFFSWNNDFSSVCQKFYLIKIFRTSAISFSFHDQIWSCSRLMTTDISGAR